MSTSTFTQIPKPESRISFLSQVCAMNKNTFVKAGHKKSWVYVTFTFSEKSISGYLFLILLAVVLGAVVLWCLSSAGNKYMVLTGQVIIDRGLKNMQARPRSQFFFSFIIRADRKLANNIFSFSFPAVNWLTSRNVPKLVGCVIISDSEKSLHKKTSLKTLRALVVILQDESYDKL